MCPLKVASKTPILAVLLIFFLSSTAQTIKGFGDSITQGYGTSDDSKRFLDLLAAKYSLTNYNYGLGGATMFNDCNDPSAECASSFTSRRFISTSEASRDYVTIFYGTNDPQYIIDSLGTKWRDTLQKYIQESFLDQGYDNEKIILVTLPYNSQRAPEHNTNARFDLVSQWIRNVAENLDLKVADLWETTFNDPTSYRLTPDQVHLNDEGHQILADLISAQMGVLPLVFTSFNVTCNNITWSTAEENNIKYLEVQQSVDGRKWQTIATLNQSSTSNYSIKYKNDKNVFFRVVETDINGRKTYSTIERSMCADKLSYKYNQATYTISVNIPSDIKIYSLAGLLVKQKTYTSELNISELASGLYILKIGDEFYKISKI